jgi:hypothetical protein
VACCGSRGSRYLSIVEFRISLAWLKDWRAAVVVGAVAGFVIALLVFKWPGRLPPAWGDVPTWILAVFAVLGGAVALNQLSLLREQLAGEARRNVDRDKLLDRQLEEAEARAQSDRRRQAEDIDVALIAPGRPSQFKGRVVNNSRRPITGVTCRIMSRAGRNIVATPDETGDMYPTADGRDPEFIPRPQPGSRFDTLRPRASCGFNFSEVSSAGPDDILVVWFTDDAGFRWQLDDYLHLVQAGSNDEYKS